MRLFLQYSPTFVFLNAIHTFRCILFLSRNTVLFFYQYLCIYLIILFLSRYDRIWTISILIVCIIYLITMFIYITHVTNIFSYNHIRDLRENETSCKIANSLIYHGLLEQTSVKFVYMKIFIFLVHIKRRLNCAKVRSELATIIPFVVIW